MNREDLIQEGDVDDDAVEQDRVEDGQDQVGVHKGGHHQDRIVLADGVQGVKHLDHDEHR